MSDMSNKQPQQNNNMGRYAAAGAVTAAVIGTALGLGKLFSWLSTKEQPRVLQEAVPYHGTTLQVLEQVCTKIRLQKEDVQRQNVQVKQMIQATLIEGLKQDALFAKLYQDILWTGSYYEGLKISAPDEFDLNIILRLPVKDSEIEVTTKGAPTAYVCINNFAAALKSLEIRNQPHWPVYKKMEKWCDAKGSLRQNKVREWLEGLMDKYINVNRDTLMKRLGLSHLRLTKSGPALTLEMNKISIDLVPAFEFKPPLLPPSPFRNLTSPPLTLKRPGSIVKQIKEPWYAVPKPVSGRDNVWRLSFCRHEQRMIHGQQRLKPAVKLIKKLRDTMQWKGLCSYFIKTVAFWEMKAGTISWNMPLDKVFMHLLRRLQSRLQEDDLTSFWDPRYSLLQNMGRQERENTANRLKRIIAAFERDWTTNPAVIGQTIAP